MSKPTSEKKHFFRASAADFKKIPGSPIAYWISNVERDSYLKGELLKKCCYPKKGIDTGENELFLKLWFEVDCQSSCLSDYDDTFTWYPYNKGGAFRKWYGNREYLINWKNDGKDIKKRKHNKTKKPTLRNPSYYFRKGFTWTTVSSGGFSARYSPPNAIFDNGGCTLFSDSNLTKIGSFLNSKVMRRYLEFLSPTLNFQPGDVGKVLFHQKLLKIGPCSEKLIYTSKTDWNFYETSWDFAVLPLLKDEYRQANLADTYETLREHWKQMALEMKQLEEENNRIFIEAYGLEDELTPDVPLKEITLTCNPYYRYSKTAEEVESGEWEVGSEEEFPFNAELEEKLLTDTMKEFISYAVGCMFGRYSLDKPGLILANQGETLQDYMKKVGSGDLGEVGSGEWEVGSEDKEKGREEEEGGVSDGEGFELQGTDCLAEGDGSGRAGLSNDKRVSERGALWSDEPGSTGSGLDSFEYSRRSGQKIDSRIYSVLIDCKRFESRDGDPNPSCPAFELCNERQGRSASESLRRSQASAKRTDEESQINNSPLSTSHSPLSLHCMLSNLHYLPDEENVLPILEDEYFSDDIAERFKKFLKITFGEDRFTENLDYIEKAIGKDIRKYFLKDFYKEHVKRYKKRPIYWLFSSPKGSFNALIYMHRYRPDMVSVVLNNYLRVYIEKLNTRNRDLEQLKHSVDASDREQTQALKEIEKNKKILRELEAYESEILYPLATKRIEIDLDDGVKHNYKLFGKALKKVTGL